jgi:hypothetical protein
MEPQFATMLANTTTTAGVVMGTFRRWRSEETKHGHAIGLFWVPQEVLAERDAAWANEVTPNMAVLGDPLPGRSALDAKLRNSTAAHRAGFGLTVPHTLLARA